ncbi:MAG: hypothetical protein ABIQ73_22415 [Acidimicrobiales bacterium]
MGRIQQGWVLRPCCLDEWSGRFGAAQLEGHGDDLDSGAVQLVA